MDSPDALIKVSNLPRLAPRAADSHKGTYGKVLIVAGSVGMSGAAILAGSAALRSGAGLVQVAIPEPILATVAAAQPCYMTAPMPATSQGSIAREARAEIHRLASSADVTVVGPGLGQNDDISDLLRSFLGQYAKPVVMDADALNAVAKNQGILADHPGALILTPHPGEFARLTGHSCAEVQSRRQELACAYALQQKAVVVLKGFQTIVTDGAQVFINNTGNPGMATGGTGDVLSGIIGALVAQRLGAFEAAVLGVHVHGLSGDLAAKDVGEVSLIATDLLDYLPDAFLKYQETATK